MQPGDAPMPPPEQPDSPHTDPPPLDEAARRIGAAGKALGLELWTAVRAFRALFVAELALSRSAILRVLVYATVATALGATAWLYLMAMGVLGLRALDLPWWAAVAIPALLSLAGAGLCVWLALQALEDTQFKATRRQLARFGIGDSPEDVERDPENVP
ncbi:phage holin family protein [Xanthomonadaceae bacterium JHOS43]|nr:phage holin family protein [Xanthomonadaceae bacterium JHOS43]MCX7564099.1 phage holin family protein [Xanthomonadaceae bacterium XH05]